MLIHFHHHKISVMLSSIYLPTSLTLFKNYRQFYLPHMFVQIYLCKYLHLYRGESEINQIKSFGRLSKHFIIYKSGKGNVVSCHIFFNIISFFSSQGAGLKSKCIPELISLSWQVVVVSSFLPRKYRDTSRLKLHSKQKLKIEFIWNFSKFF